MSREPMNKEPSKTDRLRAISAELIDLANTLNRDDHVGEAQKVQNVIVTLREVTYWLHVYYEKTQLGNSQNAAEGAAPVSQVQQGIYGQPMDGSFVGCAQEGFLSAETVASIAGFRSGASGNAPILCDEADGSEK